MSLETLEPLRSGRTVTDPSGQAWQIAEPTGTVFQLDRGTAVDLANAARRIAAALGRLDTIDDHAMLVRAEVAMRAASPDLVAALIDFRLNSSRDGVMLLRGLPVDSELPPTPAGDFDGSWRDLSVSTIGQLMVMSMLGDVISYADEKDGRLIQDVCPVPGAETRQENTGSSLLELHTEDGFHPNMPHFLSLLGLRSDHDKAAVTVGSGIRAALPLLDDETVEALCRPDFRVRLASSFVGPDRVAYSAAIPVLSGRHDDPDLCVDFHAMEPMNRAAARAFAALRDALMRTMVGVVLQRGDLLVVDNRKAVHGRTGFVPRYDGQDRWLRRCFTVTDIRASHAQRIPGSRVHQPLTAAA
jgi:L-asparagine oxygenase